MMAYIEQLLKVGTPWALLCAGLSIALAVVWKRLNQVTDKLYEVSMAQVKSNTEAMGALETVERDVQEITRQIHLPPNLRQP